MGKHKHAELIKQWADGAQVQIKMHNGVWLDIDRHHWNVDCEFRIKPAEKVVRWLWAYKTPEGFYILNRFFTEAEADKWFDNVPHKRLDYTRQEFDE